MLLVLLLLSLSVYALLVLITVWMTTVAALRSNAIFALLMTALMLFRSLSVQEGVSSRVTESVVTAM